MADVYCFGDSITRGENDPLHGGWVDRLKRLFIARGLREGDEEVCVFNLGIGGETTRSLKSRFLPELKRAPPEGAGRRRSGVWSQRRGASDGVFWWPRGHSSTT